jgi:hypothetical protein
VAKSPQFHRKILLTLGVAWNQEEYMVRMFLVLFFTLTSSVYSSDLSTEMEEVNDAVCRQCEKSNSKNLAACVQCHFCSSETFWVVWRQNIASQMSNPILEARIVYEPKEKAQLAGMGFTSPVVEKRSSQKLRSFTLNPKDVTQAFRKEFTLEYKGFPATWPPIDKSPTVHWKGFGIEMAICDDRNKDGSCVGETGETQKVLRSPTYPLCKAPHVLLFHK